MCVCVSVCLCVCVHVWILSHCAYVHRNASILIGTSTDTSEVVVTGS